MALPPALQPFFQYCSDNFVTLGVQHGIEFMHSSGLPLVASFVVSGVALRCFTAPAHIYAERLFARRLHVANHLRNAILKKASDKYKIPIVPDPTTNQLKLGQNMPELNERANKMIDDVLVKYMIDKRMQPSRIQTLKMMTSPVWIFSSFAIRNVVGADFSPNLHGALWISNFIEPDPYFVLPVLVGIFGFLNFYSQRFVFPASTTTRRMQFYDVLLGGMTCAAVVIMIKMPACIPLYWLTVSASGFAQSLMLRHPRVKSLFGIDRLPWDTRTPLRDLVSLRKQQLKASQ